jgi:hypothetical protein
MNRVRREDAFSGAIGPWKKSFPRSGLMSTTSARISRNTGDEQNVWGGVIMQNDAKLGLLAGVVGVIIAATISGKTQSSPGTDGNAAAGASPQSTSVVKIPVKPDEVAAAAVVPGQPNTTPVVQTKKTVEATTASRTQSGDEE